jgi:pimeloyl-ACP methyl ester carboxylesterase
MLLIGGLSVAVLMLIPALPGTAASSRSAAGAVAVPRLAWHPCASALEKGFECATARVPLDYRYPRGATIHLAVIRHRASDRAQRIGTLFYNPGGPGVPGTTGLASGFAFFPAALRARFDVVSWDPRGVGASTAVQCFSSLRAEAVFFRGMPTFPVGSAEMARWIARFQRFGRQCERRVGGLLRHVSTADTARDLDLLRRAVGAPMLNYFGGSYGTLLGATYANLFPDRVRAMVLDSDVNSTAWVQPERKQNGGRFLGTWLRQAADQGSAKTLGAFLDLCGRTDTAHCAFSAGSPAATRTKFAALLERLRSHPRSGEPSYAEFIGETVLALYTPFPLDGETGWSESAKLLQSLWDNATQPAPATPGVSAPLGRWPASGSRSATADNRYRGPEQQLAIYCAESPNPRAGAFPALSALAYQRSGAVGLYWSWLSEPCASWPAIAADRYTGPWNRRTANPVLLINTTIDPATPYRSAVAMAGQLARARLLTVDGYGHGATVTSACVDRAASRYFIDRALPPQGTRCRQDRQPFAR